MLTVVDVPLIRCLDRLLTIFQIPLSSAIRRDFSMASATDAMLVIPSALGIAHDQERDVRIAYPTMTTPAYDVVSIGV